MLFLETAIILFLVLVFVFFIAFAYQCLIWAGRGKEGTENIIRAISVSLFYNFKILLLGFLLILIISLFIPL